MVKLFLLLFCWIYDEIALRHKWSISSWIIVYPKTSALHCKFKLIFFYGRRLYQSIETVWFWFILDHLEVCFVSEVVSCFKILILSDYSINTIWAFLFNRISNHRRINSKIIHINLIWINADIVKACRSWKIIKKLNLNKSNVFKTQLELLQKKPSTYKTR